MVPYAGWEMAVRYDGVIAEHLAVRATAGMFDVSHMGQIETVGPAALELLERLCTNDVERIPISGAQYTLLLREDGGVLDDLFTYRLEAERYLTVTNAANHERDLAWFQSHAAALDVAVIDRAADYAMIAVQGPLAREIVQAIANAPLPERMTIGTRTVDGAEMLVAGTGYTGEDGVELLARAGGRARGMGRAGAPRRQAGRPRGARHAAHRGLLSPLRQRPLDAARGDRGRPRLVLPPRRGLHRRRRRWPRRAPAAPPSCSSRS